MTAPAATFCSERLAELVVQAGTRARATGRSVLVSLVEPVAAVDPLAVLDACERREGGFRMYWSRPADGLAVAGIGAVVSMSPVGPHRFSEVDQAWEALLADALVEDPTAGLDGVGPALFGGFSFDPDGPSTPRWREFPAALLTLPRLQVAAVGGGHWVTTSLLVAPSGAPDVDPSDLAQWRQVVTDGAHPSAPASAGGSMHLGDELPPEDWRTLVSAAVDAIRTSGLEKVVLARTRRATAARAFNIAQVLRELRSAHPECYVFGCWSGSTAFVGASPERLVRLDGSDVHASSLAGSAPRGATRGEDGAFAAALLTSPKDRVEHAMVCDALRTGLERLCDAVVAPDEPSLLTLPHVHHLHTAVRAQLRAGRSLMDLVAELHPTPAVGGAPRPAALDFIRARERLDRGWYASPIGWMGRQRGEFAVALRSALVDRAAAWLYAGCGIVAGSDPAAEFAETLLKFRPMELALAASLATDPG